MFISGSVDEECHLREQKNKARHYRLDRRLTVKEDLLIPSFMLVYAFVTSHPRERNESHSSFALFNDRWQQEDLSRSS